MFIILKTFPNWGFFTKVTCAFLLQENIMKLREINSSQPGVTTISSAIFISLKLQGYRCKLGTAIFKWRVTLNYAYYPLKLFIFLLNLFIVKWKSKSDLIYISKLTKDRALLVNESYEDKKLYESLHVWNFAICQPS